MLRNRTTLLADFYFKNLLSGCYLILFPDFSYLKKSEVNRQPDNQTNKQSAILHSAQCLSAALFLRSFQGMVVSASLERGVW